MKKISNALIVIGCGVIALSILYSLKVNSFNSSDTAIILFSSRICIILGMSINLLITRNKIPREKTYARMIFLFLYFTSITYFLINSLL